MIFSTVLYDFPFEFVFTLKMAPDKPAMTGPHWEKQMSLHTSPPSTGIMGVGRTAAPETVCVCVCFRVCVYTCENKPSQGCLMSSCLKSKGVNVIVNTIMDLFLSVASKCFDINLGGGGRTSQLCSGWVGGERGA